MVGVLMPWSCPFYDHGFMILEFIAVKVLTRELTDHGVHTVLYAQHLDKVWSTVLNTLEKTLFVKELLGNFGNNCRG